MKATLIENESREAGELETDRTLARCTEALKSLGNHAGRSGATASVPDSLVSAFGERHLQRHWNGKRRELAKRVTTAGRTASEFAIAGERFSEAVAISKQLAADRAAHPHRFSAVRGALFIALSMALFLADFPLSLLLVADVFDLKIWKPDEPLLHIFANLAHQSWMVMFLSIGIAIFPVVLKIPYEHFLSHAELKKQTAGFGRSLAHWVMAAVLLLSVATLIFLAVFRDEVHKRKLQTEALEANQELVNTEQQLNGKTESTPLPPPLQPTDSVAKWSFIFLTLTLPILGAVAAGEGATALNRRRQIKTMQNRLPALENDYLNSCAAETSAREDVKTIEESLQNQTAFAAWREIARQKAISLYLSAHEEGRRKWIEEFSNRSLYETIVLSAGEQLSPPTGNAFSTLQGGFIQ